MNEGGLSIGTSIFGQPCHISALDVQSEHSNTPLLTDQSMATTRALALQHKETESTATPQWTEVGSVLFRLQPLLAIYPSRGCSSDSNANSLMEYVGFDMDDTVICTKSGKVFASDEFDWKFWNEKVRPALRRLVLEEDKCVVLLSNQGGVAKGKVSKVQLQRKVEAVIQSLGVPVDFLCALGDDLSRKPLTGMWDLLSQYRMSQLKSSSASVRMSLFVGDAAGRPAVGTKKKDFSDSDLKLALNLNAGFNTPEEFFLSASPRSSHVCLTGTTLGSSAVASSQSAWEARLESVLKPCTETASSSDSSAVEIILLVGPPASGKSTISRLLERRLGYVRINRDKLGTVEKCLKAARQVLIDTANDSSSSGSSSGTRRSIVVDNTNIDIETRAPWLSLAIELNIPVSVA